MIFSIKVKTLTIPLFIINSIINMYVKLRFKLLVNTKCEMCMHFKFLNFSCNIDYTFEVEYEQFVLLLCVTNTLQDYLPVNS